MHTPTIHHRYAAALLSIGLENGTHETLGRGLDSVSEIVRENRDLREVFRNPKFDATTRKAVLGALLDKMQLDRVVSNFLRLLVDRGRIGSIESIAAAYRELADSQTGSVRAEVTVATTLDASELMRLEQVLGRITGKAVAVEQREDPSILGGVVTRIEGRVYDGSIRTQLEAMRGALKAAAL